MLTTRNLLIAGVGLLVVSFVYAVLFAGIPYQDAPPALQQRYEFHSSVSSVIWWAGWLVVVAAAVKKLMARSKR